MTPGEYDWIIIPFKLARKYFPQTSELMKCEYSVENDPGLLQNYTSIIKLLKVDSLIDMIGLQNHHFSTKKYNPDESYAKQTAFLKRNLDTLAAVSLPIVVIEMDIDGNIGITD